MVGEPHGFTNKHHLRDYAYSDAQRLMDRGAVYRYLKVDTIDIGPHPFRGEGLVGLVSTFLDPSLNGPALDIGCGTGQYLRLLASQCESVIAADLSAGMLATVAPRAYFRSVDDEWSSRYGVDWPTLEAAIDREIERRIDTTGNITISTASGTLIAS